MDRSDVLVVGAGPAGSTAAFFLAQRGHDVLVVEEHPRIGYPVQCAGLVSQRVLDLAGTHGMVRTAVHGASVFSPSFKSIDFKAAEPRAYVIDRAGLDIALAERAAAAGARIEVATSFLRLERAPNGGVDVRLRGESGDERVHHTQLVVGADGVSSAVARAFRLRRPVEILPAFEAEFPSSPGDADQVEVYLSNQLAPGLFGWWIPDGAGGARVGVAVRAGSVTARAYYDRLVHRLESRFGKPLPKPVNYLVSGIPIGVLPRTFGPRVVLVGDSAAQVKPLSGGGIFVGMRCAEIAADVLQEVLRSGDFSTTAIGRYETLWKAEFGDEFSQAHYLRRLFVRLTDADLEAIIEALRAANMRETIVAFGDIDFPTHVARRLLRQSPALLRLFPKALGALLSSGEPRAPDLEPGPRRAIT